MRKHIFLDKLDDKGEGHEVELRQLFN